MNPDGNPGKATEVCAIICEETALRQSCSISAVLRHQFPPAKHGRVERAVPFFDFGADDAVVEREGAGIFRQRDGRRSGGKALDRQAEPRTGELQPTVRVPP